jgi:hypothetical protein
MGWRKNKSGPLPHGGRPPGAGVTVSGSLEERARVAARREEEAAGRASREAAQRQADADAKLVAAAVEKVGQILGPGSTSPADWEVRSYTEDGYPVSRAHAVISGVEVGWDGNPWVAPLVHGPRAGSSPGDVWITQDLTLGSFGRALEALERS